MVRKPCGGFLLSRRPSGARVASRRALLTTLLVMMLAIMPAKAAPPTVPLEPGAVALTPLSGADGALDIVKEAGADTYRSRLTPRSTASTPVYDPYLYLQAPVTARFPPGTLYLQVTYRDVDFGPVRAEFSERDGKPYQLQSRAIGNIGAGTGRWRTGVWQLPNAELRRAQNLHADMRLIAPSTNAPLQIANATVSVAPPLFWRDKTAPPVFAPSAKTTRQARGAISTDGLRGKTVVGYQGWFRAPGDAEERGWFHWSRDGQQVTPQTITVEMWPDLREADADEKFYTPAYKLPDGTPAPLFSSVQAKTVNRHFEWMRTYGIDGVFIQRFVGLLPDRDAQAREARALILARDAANRTGRVFAVEYDISGVAPDAALARIRQDWQYLIETLRLTEDDRYLREGGKPVLAVFGLFPDRFSGADASRLMDGLTMLPQAPFLVGGVPGNWRQEKNDDWKRAFRRLGAIKPWNVGNYRTENGNVQAETGGWAEDLAQTRRDGILYLPVLYPGFSWDNLTRQKGTTVPRRGGDFFREQVAALVREGIGQAFVAMFDEVDEGTAIFKILDTPPAGGPLLGLEGKPSDYYLRLTGEATKVIREVSRGKKPDLPSLLRGEKRP